MSHYTLDFGEIIILQDDIAEVIIHEGVEMDDAIVDQYHAFLLMHLQSPFSLLINKINPYTYTFSAQLKLANLPQIHAMAVVAYNRVTEMTTESLNNMPREYSWNLKVFNNKDVALDWLKAEQGLAAVYE